jgi:hypothetical protein
MRGILFDLIVLLLAAWALVRLGGWAFGRTAVGVRWRQSRNRRVVERRRSAHCPRHGDFAERDLVRLPSGETLCPSCYEEIYHADLH